MIRKLSEQDREQLLTFLSPEPSINLFIIGDIENYGFDHPIQDLWGDFDGQGNYNGVLLRYREHFIIYAEGGYDQDGFVQIIEDFGHAKVLSGKTTIMEALEGRIQPKKSMKEFFCELDDTASIPEVYFEQKVEKATLEDVPDLFKLRQSIDEFSDMETSEDNMRQTLESGSGRTYFVRKDGSVVAAASTTAENSRSAMVVGVCTHSEYRHKGYASACVAQLCRDLLEEGKTACLFFDNPKAGRIYKRIGFKEIDGWTMMLLK